MKNIEQIEESNVVGNAYHDMPLMNEIDKFVRGDHPVIEKIRALQKLSEVMGLNENITEATVEEYVNFVC